MIFIDLSTRFHRLSTKNQYIYAFNTSQFSRAVSFHSQISGIYFVSSEKMLHNSNNAPTIKQVFYS